MMVQTVFFCSLTFLALFQQSNSMVILGAEYDNSIACNHPNDSVCGIDEFCSSKTNYCEKCVPCTERFNRQPAANNPSCAQTEQDCGYCLPGYVADSLANERIFSTKCYLPSEKLSTSNNNPSNKSETSPSALTIFLAMMFFVIMVALGFLVYFHKGIRKYISPLPANNTESIEMGSIESLIAAGPSAPCLLEEVVERLSNVEEDRLCRAVPIGPYHEYQPVNTEDDHPVRERISSQGSFRDNEESIINAIENGPSSEPTTSHPKINSPSALEMAAATRLFDRQISADVSPVRPAAPVYRSASDSGLSNPHIRLSHHRPSANATNTSAEESSAGPEDTIQDQLQENENCVKVGLTIRMKRK